MDEIITLYLKIDRDKALEAIYTKYYPKVKSLCYKLLYNKREIDDVVQDIFLKIYENIDKFTFKSGIGTWIYRITLNHVINKNKKIDFCLEFNEEILGKNNFVELTINLDIRRIEQEVDMALNKLKDEDKKVFILREIEGMSYKEIAKILAINEGTVKSKIFYLRVKLQEILKQLYEEL